MIRKIQSNRKTVSKNPNKKRRANTAVHVNIGPPKRVSSINTNKSHSLRCVLSQNVKQSNCSQKNSSLINHPTKIHMSRASIKKSHCENPQTSGSVDKNISTVHKETTFSVSTFRDDQRKLTDSNGMIIDHHLKPKEKKLKSIYLRRCCVAFSLACIFVSVMVAVILLALLIKPTKTQVRENASTTTTTTNGLTLLTSTNETIYGLWNTVVGGNSTLATAGTGAGNYVAAENPPNAFDLNINTKYDAYGSCGAVASPSPACGVNTGLYLTLSRGSSLLQSFRFCAANDIPSRDPMTVTIEGSNQPSSSLLTGSSWTPIYSGTTGLDTDPGRYTYGVRQSISNSAWYTSYRVLITSVRIGELSTQYAEIELTGY